MLNHFFPSTKKGELPRWQRPFARALRWLGPSWRASPLRRTVQSVSFVLYLYLFLYVAWPHAEVFATTVLSDKEWLPAGFFLRLDPLLALSTVIAARHVGVALLWMAGILAVCLIIPRGFCGYLCPLGSLVDIFDWLIGRRMKRLRAKRRGWWVHLRYYLLAGVLASSAFGVLLAGYLSAIPVLNRAFLLGFGPLQLGLLKHWSMVRPLAWTSYLALSMLPAVLLLGLFGGRFWCRYVCPTGALFSVANVLRLNERKVGSSCTGCGRCVRACPFDAIKGDFATRSGDCTFCQTCGGVCPVRAIKFVSRWNREDLRAETEPRASEVSVSRRAFVLSAIGGIAAAGGMRTGLFDGFRDKPKLLRPPGSVPEPMFSDLCIRCGECMKVCPGPVLHPAGLEGGLESLWTPMAVPLHAGCHQDCNFCTQVCPTGAIRPLTIEEKRKTRMGLARVDRAICLPHAGVEDCRHCSHVCESAGYHAIEMQEIELEMGDVPEGVFSDLELEAMSHIRAPFVVRDLCVGCGQCENRCHTVNVIQAAKLEKAAISVSPLDEDGLV